MPMIRRVLETETSACYGKTRQPHEFYVTTEEVLPGDEVLALESLDPKVAADLRACFPAEYGDPVTPASAKRKKPLTAASAEAPVT